eukprot:scaffold248_cov111-Cylindrotheca_fusiformis.AAC.5
MKCHSSSAYATTTSKSATALTIRWPTTGQAYGKRTVMSQSPFSRSEVSKIEEHKWFEWNDAHALTNCIQGGLGKPQFQAVARWIGHCTVPDLIVERPQRQKLASDGGFEALLVH